MFAILSTHYLYHRKIGQTLYVERMNRKNMIRQIICSFWKKPPNQGAKVRFGNMLEKKYDSMYNF